MCLFGTPPPLTLSLRQMIIIWDDKCFLVENQLVNLSRVVVNHHSIKPQQLNRRHKEHTETRPDDLKFQFFSFILLVRTDVFFLCKRKIQFLYGFCMVLLFMKLYNILKLNFFEYTALEHRVYP